MSIACFARRHLCTVWSISQVTAELPRDHSLSGLSVRKHKCHETDASDAVFVWSVGKTFHRRYPIDSMQNDSKSKYRYLLVFVVSVVSYQDVGYTVVFLFRKLLKLCVLPPWFQVVVEALLAKHGDLSAQDQSGATPSGAPSGLVEPVEPVTRRWEDLDLWQICKFANDECFAKIIAGFVTSVLQNDLW